MGLLSAVDPSARPTLLPRTPPRDLFGDARLSPRIVAIGGGSGLPVVLEGLCAHAAQTEGISPDSVTGVVTVTDDGGSSGPLCQEFGVLPPDDVRNCLAALAAADSPYRALLDHRLDGI